MHNRQSQTTPIPDTSKVFKIAFLICTMINCTNSQVLMLIHYILSDIIETNGGSCQLIRVFNKMGCAASPDSHDRYVTFHAQEQQIRNP